MSPLDEAPVKLPVPLALGTKVKPWGTIGAILLTGGERYYLLSKGREVAMMPWFVVEPNAFAPPAKGGEGDTDG